jgi:hypothetical protein
MEAKIDFSYTRESKEIAEDLCMRLQDPIIGFEDRINLLIELATIWKLDTVVDKLKNYKPDTTLEDEILRLEKEIEYLKELQEKAINGS